MISNNHNCNRHFQMHQCNRNVLHYKYSLNRDYFHHYTGWSTIYNVISCQYYNINIMTDLWRHYYVIIFFHPSRQRDISHRIAYVQVNVCANYFRYYMDLSANGHAIYDTTQMIKYIYAAFPKYSKKNQIVFSYTQDN